MHYSEYPTFGTWKGVPIEWCVLETAGSTRLLLSRYILDAHVFHPDCIYTSWARSTVREWLHTVFLPQAFTPDEQSRIRQVTLHTPPSPGIPSVGEEITEDRIFLLSGREVEHYFPQAGSRIASAEETARRESPDLRDFTALLPFYQGVQGCWWWLRDPGAEPNQMHIVWSDGTVCAGGHYVNYERGIRPALRIG